MSRRRSASNNNNNASNPTEPMSLAGPSTSNTAEGDMLMGPPPVPAYTQQQQGKDSKAKDPQELAEKYKKLKRRYFELEDKHKEASDDLHRSGVRNFKLNEERGILLDRIMELEQQGAAAAANGNGTTAPAQPPNAYPRSLINSRAQASFTSNLRTAMAEDDITPLPGTEGTEEEDPALRSRHVGAGARQAEEAGGRPGKRPRNEGSALQGQAGMQTQPPADMQGMSGPGMSGGQPGMHMLPPQVQGPGNTGSGTRLKIVPTAVPDANIDPQLASSSGQVRPAGPVRQASNTRAASVQSGSSSPASSNGQLYSPSYMLRPVRESLNGSLQQHTRSEAGSASPRPMQHTAGSPFGPQQGYYPPLPHSPNTPGSSRGGPAGPGADKPAKPKRLKAHTVTSRSYSIPMVPRDKHGRPLLPLNVGIMTVVHLGKICMREHFHTERYIFPVGYEVTRRYPSTIDPRIEVVYHCTILDGGDGPKFQIIAADRPDQPIIAGTATGAWSTVVKQANQIRHRQHSNSVSGPDFFGLGQNTIKHLIQELPNADRLKDYVWQHFIEGGPLGGRHAAVIPALPDEYDSAVPIGPYYPNEQEERERRELMEQRTRQEQQDAFEAAQMQAQGQQTIMLPSPASAEGLNIQEYQPPHTAQSPVGMGRASSGTPVRDYYPRARSQSQTLASPKPQAQQSPPMAGPGAMGASTSNPYGPMTFASIMNAYPAPAGSEMPQQGQSEQSGSVASE